MTITEIEELLVELKGAYKKVLTGQEYTTQDGRRLRRADLSEISKEIKYWSKERDRLASGGNLKVRVAFPVGV